MDAGPNGVLSKSGSAYEHLKRLAVEGLLRPGRRLSPNDIAADFQISITPVRDALVRLHAEGYIGGEAGRGYFTKPFTVDEQHDLLRMTQIGLLTCLEEGRERWPDALGGEITAFDAAISAVQTPEDPRAAEAFVREYDQFLLAVAGRSRSVLLQRLIRNAMERTWYIRRLDARDADARAAAAERLVRGARLTLKGQFVEAIGVAREGMADQLARLPALVAEANLAIGGNRFP